MIAAANFHKCFMYYLADLLKEEEFFLFLLTGKTKTKGCGWSTVSEKKQQKKTKLQIPNL